MNTITLTLSPLKTLHPEELESKLSAEKVSLQYYRIFVSLFHPDGIIIVQPADQNLYILSLIKDLIKDTINISPTADARNENNISHSI